MATAEELQKYLAKRGYSAEVSTNGDNFLIGLSCKTIEEVANTLAEIAEPGRFIVSVSLPDVADLLGDMLNTPKHGKDIEALNSRLYALEDEVSKNAKRLEESDESLKRQSEASIGSLQDEIAKLKAEIERIHAIPWWKRFTGVR